MGIKKEKTKQLGMNPGTASNRLKKNLLFEFAKRLDMHWCYQCAAEIKDSDDFSIEHKTPWLHSEDPLTRVATIVQQEKDRVNLAHH